MKISKAFFLYLCVAGGMIFTSCRQSQDQNTAVRPSGPADPFGKYDPGITYYTARTIDSTVITYADDPDMRSLEENIWVRLFQEHLGISMGYKWIGTDDVSHAARWSAAIASGDVPDFASVNSNVYKQLYDAGYIAEMDEIFNSYVSPELKNIIPQNLFDQMTLDGKMYGFPIPAGGGIDTLQMFYRKDWFDKAGLEVPKTFEDVVNAARAFQRANLGGNDTIGIVLGNDQGTGAFNAILNSFGAYSDMWIDQGGSLVYSQTLPEWRDALLALQALYTEGIINRDFAAIRSAEVIEIMGSEKAGITYAVPWGMSSVLNALHESNPEALFSIALPPTTGGRAIPYKTSNPTIGYIFVSNKSSYPEAAVKMMNLVHKLEIEDYAAYCSTPPGRAGLRNKFVPTGLIFPPYREAYAAQAISSAVAEGRPLSQEELALVGIETNYFRYTEALAGRDVYSTLYTQGRNGYYWNIWDALQRNLILHDRFTGLPTETQLLRGNAIYDEINMTIFDVIMGADISNYDRAVERWKANGGNQITEEVNAWYRSVRK